MLSIPVKSMSGDRNSAQGYAEVEAKGAEMKEEMQRKEELGLSNSVGVLCLLACCAQFRR